MSDAGSGEYIKVLISYAQESDEQRLRVRKLADQLCIDGVDANIDQYQPHPPQGWPMWMEQQLDAADFVLVVFTETYWKRAEGHEEPGRGLGVAWEADLIREWLYQSPHDNSRIVPILFRSSDERFIMSKLKAVTRYVINADDLGLDDSSNGYCQLYRRVTNQPLVIKPVIGRLKKLDPLPSTAASRGAPALNRSVHQGLAMASPPVQAVSGEHPAIKIWRSRIEFLRTEEAKAADPAIKFNIRQGIEDAEAKIRELRGQL